MLPSVLATSSGHRWEKGQDLPLEERVLGTPTAWKAKEGEVVAMGMAGLNNRKRVGLLFLFLFLWWVCRFIGWGFICPTLV